MIITSYIRKRKLRFILQVVVLILFNFSVLYAQDRPFPPRPIKVTKTADLAFGTFYIGASGGTVVVTSIGGRSSTGDVVLLGIGHAPAVFKVSGNPGTLVTPLLGGTATLTGSPMGSMTLTLNVTTNPPSPFVLPGPLPPNAVVDVFVGGTLTVGSSGVNPPGSYTGTFEITFTQNYN